MKTKYNYILIGICLLFISKTTQSQTSQNFDVTVVATVMPSTCQANGEIHITIGGGDANLLTQIEYVIARTGGTQSYSNTPDFFNLPGGDYTVEVKGEINNGDVSYTTTCNVPTTYSTLQANKVPAHYNTGTGTRPTFACIPTGRIQLQISGGALPYIVVIERNSALWRIDTFYTRESEYNIENLEEGSYRFIITDACTYSIPVFETVSVSDAFHCGGVRRTNYGFNPSSRILITDFLLLDGNEFNGYGYEHKNGIKSWWEYRVSREDGSNYSVWQDIPADGKFSDTIAARYCDIYGKHYKFQFRVKGCSNIVCETGGFHMVDWYVITYSSSLSVNNRGCPTDTMLHIHNVPSEFVRPLSVKITNQSGSDTYYDDTLKDDMPLPPAAFSQPCKVMIIDSIGCTVYDGNIPFSAPRGPVWQPWQLVCQVNGVSVKYTGTEPPDSTVIKMVRSPNNNAYNYTAIYRRSTQSGQTGQWTFTGFSDTIVQLYAPSVGEVALTDTTLHEGWYEWNISNSCGEFEVTAVQAGFHQWWLPDFSGPCRNTDMISVRYTEPCAYRRGTVLRLIESPDSAYSYEARIDYRTGAFHLTKYDIRNNGDTTYNLYLQNNYLILEDTKMPAGIYKWLTTDAYGRHDTTTLNATFHDREDWRYNHTYNECEPNRLHIYYDCNTAPQGAVIELTQPASLKFKATYNATNNTWSIDKTSTGGVRTDTIYTTSNRITIEAPALPSGQYEWHITDSVGWNITHKLGKDRYESPTLDFYSKKITEHLSHRSFRRCYGDICYPKSKVTSFKNDNANTVINAESSRFSVIGDSTGYSINNSGSMNSGETNRDSIIIYKPGTYVIKAELLCGIIEYDTVVSYGTALVLKDVLGYVCYKFEEELNNTLPYKTGKIVVAIDTVLALPPVRYELYDTSMKFVYGNTTGIINDIGHVGEKFTVRLYDQCGTSYMQPLTIQGIGVDRPNKILQSQQPCHGSSITLRAINISGGSICTYAWSGPNGFNAYGKSITIDNFDSQKEGKYYLTITGLSCILRDSINLEPNYVKGFVIDTICETDNYSGKKFKPFNAETLTPGIHVFFDTIQSANPLYCDSIVRLGLYVVPVPRFDVFNATVCADDTVIPVVYQLAPDLQDNPLAYSVQFTGTNILSSEVKEVSMENDTVFNRVLLPPIADIRPNVYDASLWMINRWQCTWEQPFSVLSLYSKKVMEQNWNDVIALLNEEHNGGYIFSEYQWFKNGVKIENGGKSYIYETLDTTAQYTVLLKRLDDNLAFMSCPLTPTMVRDTVVEFIEENNTIGIELYPTILKSNSVIIVRSLSTGEAVWYNIMGKEVARQNFGASDKGITLRVPAEEGFYFVEVNVFEKKKIFRIVVSN